jgi:hypothetical protein
VSPFEPVPEHHEWHIGPYGVEQPLDYTPSANVTEVTVEMSSGDGGGGSEQRKSDASESAGETTGVEGPASSVK